MIIKDVIKHIEAIAPISSALKFDNPGLQIGSFEEQVHGIYLCLDLTQNTLNEALNLKTNLIITHHPLIYEPIKTLNFRNKEAQLIKDIINNNLNIYSAHTNLDASKKGINIAAAELLGLKNVTFLKQLPDSLIKISVFTPSDYVEKVSEAMFKQGAGIIGDYKKCGFRVSGTGTFEPEEFTNPFIGNKKSFNEVPEEKIEVIANKWNLNNILKAIYNSHPYEEPAIDIFPLLNDDKNYGFGIVGELTKELTFEEFSKLLKEKLNLKNFKYTKGKSNIIKKVAYCGGSGADLLTAAIANNCDVFVTADIKYHTYHNAQNNIYLIDAGHYETEYPGIIYLYNYLKNIINNVEIHLSSISTNPIEYYQI